MKKHLFFAASLFAGTAALAQTNTFPATGNAGIGTTSPTQKLEVYDGNLKISNDASPATLILYGDRGNTADDGRVDNRISFQTDNNPAERWDIDALNFASAGQMKFIYTHAGVLVNALVLGDGTTAGQGKVGIGTTNPGSLLHVYGTADVGLAKNGLAIFGPTDEDNIAIDQNEIMARTNGAAGNLLLNKDGGIVDIFNTTQGVLQVNNNNLYVGAGNVGIGTVTPSEKLAVNGKIRAKEIKVETTNWPDYVLADDYKQMTVKELEDYIKLNRHLPGMPTAKEAETNGVELGELNKLLLKKIEEMTLLMIEQHKNIEAFGKEIKSLKETVSKLEKH